MACPAFLAAKLDLIAKTQKKFNRCLLISMSQYRSPFAEPVEGPSPFWNKSYAIQRKKQTDDI